MERSIPAFYRASGTDTAFHRPREGVNSFALGTTADAQDSPSPALSSNEKQTTTPPVSGLARRYR